MSDNAYITYYMFLPISCRSIGAVGTTMVSSLLVPLSIVAFTCVPVTYLPKPVISSNFLVGATILVAGQLTFNFPTLKAAFDSWRAQHLKAA